MNAKTYTKLTAEVRNAVTAWLGERNGSAMIEDESVPLKSGVPIPFSAVSADRRAVGYISVKSADTFDGKPSTSSLADAVLGVKLLKQLPATVERRWLVFTDSRLMERAQERFRRTGEADGIKLLHCQVQKELERRFLEAKQWRAKVWGNVPERTRK